MADSTNTLTLIETEIQDHPTDGLGINLAIAHQC
jgi:hypothetical protein